MVTELGLPSPRWGVGRKPLAYKGAACTWGTDGLEEVS